MIFVFGSNEAGRHGKGSALHALKHKGAKYGKEFGHYGNSFAIPTKDRNIQTMPLERIQLYVRLFIHYAKHNPKLKFQIIQIGCGLAGYKPKDIALMFNDASENCFFHREWKPWLKDKNFYN